VLVIQLPEQEFFNESDQTFFTSPGLTLQLEHSLLSLSKWESLHEKPFLTNSEKTDEEVRSYISCMVMAPEDVPPEFVKLLTSDHYNAITNYIDRKMTATWFSEKPKKSDSEIVTAEVIYYWMTSFAIPFSCETWHLNRLLTLIKVCTAKTQPPKKMRQSDILARNRELNARRKAALHTRG
jgi:hypothetical protein